MIGINKKWKKTIKTKIKHTALLYCDQKMFKQLFHWNLSLWSKDKISDLSVVTLDVVQFWSPCSDSGFMCFNLCIPHSILQITIVGKISLLYLFLFFFIFPINVFLLWFWFNFFSSISTMNLTQFCILSVLFLIFLIMTLFMPSEFSITPLNRNCVGRFLTFSAHIESNSILARSS